MHLVARLHERARHPGEGARDHRRAPRDPAHLARSINRLVRESLEETLARSIRLWKAFRLATGWTRRSWALSVRSGPP